MELNPNTPRQRNRRADRAAQAAMQEPVQQSVPVVQRVQTVEPQPYAATARPIAPAQTVAPAQPTAPAQPGYAQTPRAMYQQTAQAPAYQPVRPTGYPQVQQPYGYNGYIQQPQVSAPRQAVQQAMPIQQAMPVQQTAPIQQAAPAPRPRALNQTARRDSGWQQPTIHPVETPHARAAASLTRETARAERQAQRQAQQEAKEKARRDERKAEKPAEKPARKKLPAWLTTAMTLAFLGMLALGAVYWLMQAYLVTQENARIAAREAVLSNYHVTEEADGTLRITWQEEIEKYAAQYNLQPAFVAAIIRTESSFRTNAESSVGARGLMQLMPDTAEWIAGKLDDSSYTFDRMYDGETNIRYGCWYLGYLSRLFRGDAVLVSAAYHAGQTTVTQWLSDRSLSADGVSLDADKLADGPTKQYIGRVTQTYGIYQTLLYPDEAFDAADAVSAGSGDAAAAGR